VPEGELQTELGRPKRRHLTEVEEKRRRATAGHFRRAFHGRSVETDLFSLKICKAKKGINKVDCN
jgi:hypothetical protein